MKRLFFLLKQTIKLGMQYATKLKAYPKIDTLDCVLDMKMFMKNNQIHSTF